MKRLTNIALFAVGLGVFGYLIWQFGVDQILANVQKAGWSLAYVIVVWLAIYLLNTVAWRLALGEHGKDIAFPKLFAITVSGFVLNYITPVVALGGEPYKVKALSGTIDSKQSLSAVVLYRMIHLLGHMLLLLAGTVVALLTLFLAPVLNIALILLACCLLGIILLTLAGHRHGVFERLQRFIAGTPLLRKAAPLLHRYEGHLEGMDNIITGVYRHRRERFYLAIAIEFLSRVCMGVEVYLILHGVGVETSMASAMFIYVVYSVIINLLFFIPLNVGAREGGLYLGLETLALPPLLGVYLGVVIRVREFFWILLGLLFILFTTTKKEPEPTAPM